MNALDYRSRYTIRNGLPREHQRVLSALADMGGKCTRYGTLRMNGSVRSQLFSKGMIRLGPLHGTGRFRGYYLTPVGKLALELSPGLALEIFVVEADPERHQYTALAHLRALALPATGGMPDGPAPVARAPITESGPRSGRVRSGRRAPDSMRDRQGAWR